MEFETKGSLARLAGLAAYETADDVHSRSARAAAHVLISPLFASLYQKLDALPFCVITPKKFIQNIENGC